MNPKRGHGRGAGPVCLLGLLFFCATAQALQEDKPESVERLAALLKGRDASVRGRAILSLVKLGGKEYAGDIAKFLEDGDGRVRQAAGFALRELHADHLVGDIADLLGDKAARVRLAAIFALLKCDATAYTEEIAEVLKERPLEAPGPYAVLFSGANCPPGVMSFLLEDPDPAVRKQAAHDLGQVDVLEYARDITALLKQGKPAFVYNASWALRKTSPEEALQLLRKARDAEKDPSVRTVMESALKRLESGNR